MKKSAVIGAIIVFVLIGVMSTLFMLNRMASKVQQNAHTWIDTSVPVIIKDWNSEELIKRASPGLLKAASHEQFVALFKTLSDKLGPLQEYKGSKGETAVSLRFNGITKNGTYEPEALFAKGSAVILCRLVWLDGSWKIEEFRVQSDVLEP